MGDSISQAAKITGLTEHTLRYYERVGLLPYVYRSPSGNRIYSEKDYECITVINCLKNTGMQIKDIKRFMDWCIMGDSTLEERLNMFKEQKKKAEQQLADLKKHMEKIEYKIGYYETAVKAGTEAIHNGHSCYIKKSV
jgi:DNA-binding transcriptional MerR regulator